MNLIQQVKHWAGLGLEIDVELERVYLSPGSTLVYQVTLKSEETLQVRALYTELIKGNAAPGSGEWGSEAAYFAADSVPDIEVQADLPYTLTRSIQLPVDLPLTTAHGKDAIHWSLRITADIPGGRDPYTIVGFVVGPAHTCPWETDGPIQISTSEKRYLIIARGEYRVVQVAEDGSEMQATIPVLISEALADLLNEQPEFLTDRDRPQYQRDLCGALQELVIPRVRTATSIPVDSILSLTVATIIVDAA